jgi:hypothetical protein
VIIAEHLLLKAEIQCVSKILTAILIVFIGMRMSPLPSVCWVLEVVNVITQIKSKPDYLLPQFPQYKIFYSLKIFAVNMIRLIHNQLGLVFITSNVLEYYKNCKKNQFDTQSTQSLVVFN